MKTIPALAYIAAFAAFVFLPLNFSVAGSILFSAALITIAYSDYSRGAASRARNTWRATEVSRVRRGLSGGVVLSAPAVYGSRAPI